MSKKEFKFKPSDIPLSPGCYLFYDKDGDLLYVGKAKNLRKRVSSYFQKKAENNRLKVMTQKISRIETRLVQSEIESLILERNLIKEYMPRFNVRLRDDKNFMYLRITKEDFPKLELTRKMLQDDSTYIGPKTSSKSLRDTVRFCQKFFGARMVKPGQDYYLNVVADKEVSKDEYNAQIESMKKFLRGHTSGVLKTLQEQMMAFASEKNFEAAAKTRDLIQSIQGSTERQVVSFSDTTDRDFINFVRDERKAYFVRVAYREGRYRDQNEVALEAEPFESDEEVLTQFLLQFYEKVADLPKEVILPLKLNEQDEINAALETIHHSPFTIHYAQKGDKEKVLRIARLNAEKFRDTETLAAMSQEENFAKALPELAKALNLKDPPRRIECYDISHYSGQGTVGSMVVFVDGKPKNSQYRRFHIKELEAGKIDDFASMAEVLKRRFGRINTSNKPTPNPSLVREGSSYPPVKGDGERSEPGGLQMKPVKTQKEWKAYHEIRKKELFEAYHPDITYDPDYPDEKKKGNHPMVFVRGKEVVGTVRLDHKGKKRIILRLFAIKKSLQGQGLGARALELMESYTREQERAEIVLNANSDSVGFYEKFEFERDYWKGDSKLSDQVPMGKKLVSEKWETPDLIVIDGGKGQLSAVLKVLPLLDKGGGQGVDLIALAKREEQIFLPGKKDPLELPFDSPALKLLQRIRDEAHRFAITFNRAVRKKAATTSALDEVPGIGGATKKKLMGTFQTVGNIRKASDEDLLKILTHQQLENLRRHL